MFGDRRMKKVRNHLIMQLFAKFLLLLLRFYGKKRKFAGKYENENVLPMFIGFILIESIDKDLRVNWHFVNFKSYKMLSVLKNAFDISRIKLSILCLIWSLKS
jgi:hypothetical protein